MSEHALNTLQHTDSGPSLIWSGKANKLISTMDKATLMVRIKEGSLNECKERENIVKH